jgi:vitamin B12 transporter
MIRTCGVIFLSLLYSLPLFADEPHTLEKIVIFKSFELNKGYFIDSGYLKNSSVTSIPQAIGLLGIDTQPRLLNHGVQTDFSYRGLGFENLAILLDGQRINDPQTGHHNSDIPLSLEDIKGIELDSLRGTINIVPKSAQESENSFQNSYGEYQTYASRLSISNKKNSPGLRLTLERKESRGFRYDTDFKLLTANLYSNLEFSPGQEAVLLLGYNEKEFGAYDFYTPQSGYPSKEWTKTLILDSGLNLELADFVLKPRFLWRRHFDKFMLDKTQLKSDYLNHHRTDVYTGGLSLQMHGWFFDSLCLDAEVAQEEISSTRLGRHARGHYGIYIDTQKQLTSQMLIDSRLVFDYFDSFKDRVTGSIILGYLLSQHQQLSLGVSSAIRSPTFTENYYEDPLTRGNPDLAPEEMLTCQLAYDYKGEQLDVGLAVFFREEENLINWVRRNPGELWQARNMLEADCWGVQAHFQKRFNSTFKGGFNYTYLDKRLKDAGWLYKYGYNYAIHLLNSFVEFDLPLFSSSVELQYKKRPRGNGWFLLDLSVWRNINKNVRVFCKVSNLLNVEYQDIEGIPSPGRWAEVGIRLEW